MRRCFTQVKHNHVVAVVDVFGASFFRVLLDVAV
jgi:hypothetical protein